MCVGGCAFVLVVMCLSLCAVIMRCGCVLWMCLCGCVLWLCAVDVSLWPRVCDCVFVVVFVTVSS